MSRNQSFHPLHEPLRHHNSFELQEDKIGGPFSFLNPTRAYFRHIALAQDSSLFSEAPHESIGNGPKGGRHSKDNEQVASNIEFKWRSRDNRKGRHTLLVDPSIDPSAKLIAPQSTSSPIPVAQGILRMVTQCPYWDISYLVAAFFTLGSVVWVINAFFVWLPDVQPGTDFRHEVLTGGGVTAFIGATIFEVGSILLMFEAVNENRVGCFGWALQKALHGEHDDEEEGKLIVRPDTGGCLHHHTNKNNLVGKSHVNVSGSNALISNNDSRGVKRPEDGYSSAWIWFPTLFELSTHYLRELGFLASLSQFAGATIFWISGFTALPGINNKMSQNLLDGIYWAPQIVGGTGFIISGIFFMLETQSIWYIPAPKLLGWHIGFWNLIGAFGFTLSGALGPAYGNSGAQYEAGLATFWGSWAFLIGSLIQLYESLDKHPVELQSKDATI